MFKNATAAPFAFSLSEDVIYPVLMPGACSAGGEGSGGRVELLSWSARGFWEGRKGVSCAGSVA